MTSDLSHLVLALALQTDALSAARDWATIAQRTVATIAIVVGGGWAYFKFIRGRTFRRRLELTVAGEVRRGPGLVYLLTNSSAKNIGLSKFEIDHETSGLRVMHHASEAPAQEARLANWQPISTWPIFEGQELLEPGEPTSEELLIEIPEQNPLAFRLQLWVTSTRGESWEVTAIVNLASGDDNNGGSKPAE